MRKCYGWLQIKSEEAGGTELYPGAVRLPKILRETEPDQTYYAIIYEYIPLVKNDLDRVAATLDFCWRAGLDSSQANRIDNWSDGVLLDMSDLFPPFIPYRSDIHYRASLQKMLCW